LYLHIDHGGQRHHLAGLGTHVIAGQVVRCPALVLRHLSNHVIGAIEPVEAVDVVFTHQYRQRFRYLVHGDAHLTGLCGVDGEVRPRAVEGQIAVDKGKQTTAPGGAFDDLHGVIEFRKIGGRSQYHLYRQTATSRR